MELEDVSSHPLPSLPPRGPDSHKGDFGRLGIVGGSFGMSGAPALAGTAALRSGAGLVTLAVPRAIVSTVSSFEPAYMTLPLPEDDHGRIAPAAAETVLERLGNATALAVGPGLGRSPELTQFVLELELRFDGPLVLDADALFALSQAGWSRASRPNRVLTPHAAEFARLLACEPAAVAANRLPLAADFARRTGCILLLKGRATIVTDGLRYSLNATGNPGMATGGSGDVLTGVLTSLAGQGFSFASSTGEDAASAATGKAAFEGGGTDGSDAGRNGNAKGAARRAPFLSTFDAARLAAHVHGLAGDLAAAELGQVGLIASDLPKFLPAAFRQLGG